MIQRAHAQMRAANFDDDAEILWAEAVNNANDMEISSNTLNKKSPRDCLQVRNQDYIRS
jgi:hypothetical protein